MKNVIKKFKPSDYTLTITEEVDLWANLAGNCFGIVLEVTTEDDEIEIEFVNKFKDVTGVEHELDPVENAAAFKRFLESYRKR